MYKLSLSPTRSTFDNRPIPGPNFANTGSYLVVGLHHTPWVKDPQITVQLHCV